MCQDLEKHGHACSRESSTKRTVMLSCTSSVKGDSLKARENVKHCDGSIGEAGISLEVVQTSEGGLPCRPYVLIARGLICSNYSAKWSNLPFSGTHDLVDRPYQPSAP